MKVLGCVVSTEVVDVEEVLSAPRVFAYWATDSFHLYAYAVLRCKLLTDYDSELAQQ